MSTKPLPVNPLTVAPVNPLTLAPGPCEPSDRGPWPLAPVNPLTVAPGPCVMWSLEEEPRLKSVHTLHDLMWW